MSYFSAIAILLFVLSPLLIPTMFHAAHALRLQLSRA